MRGSTRPAAGPHPARRTAAETAVAAIAATAEMLSRLAAAALMAGPEAAGTSARLADREFRYRPRRRLLPFRPRQRRANQRTPLQIEWTRRLLAGQTADFALSPLRGQRAEIDDRQRERGLGVNDLDRAGARLGRLGEARAQRLVAADDLQQAPLQGRRVEPAAEPEAGRNVVKRAPRRQTVEEPQTLLRKGERQRSGTR